MAHNSAALPDPLRIYGADDSTCSTYSTRCCCCLALGRGQQHCHAAAQFDKHRIPAATSANNIYDTTAVAAANTAAAIVQGK
jgi:hypothetical protein